MLVTGIEVEWWVGAIQETECDLLWSPQSRFNLPIVIHLKSMFPGFPWLLVDRRSILLLPLPISRTSSLKWPVWFQLIWEAWIKSVDVVYTLWNKWKYNHAQWIVFYFSFWILTVNTSKHDGFFPFWFIDTESELCFYFVFLGSNWQILAYLLVSASSSAATRVDDWQSNWGKDEFTEMATASVVMAFLAFIAYAGSSIISGYNLYNRDAIWWHSHIIFEVMEKEKSKSHMQFFLFNVV